MRDKEVLQIFKEIGAFITDGHFVLSSNRQHSAEYLEKRVLYHDEGRTRQLCGEIARRFMYNNVDIVIGPMTGGKTISRLVADYLTITLRREIPGLYAEKKGNEFVVLDKYHKFIVNKRVLVADDVLTTGQSAKKVVELVRKIGGNVIGFGVLLNRGGLRAQDVGVEKISALVNMRIKTWDASACKLCKQGIPINVTIGHGREFLVSQRQKIRR